MRKIFGFLRQEGSCEFSVYRFRREQRVRSRLYGFFSGVELFCLVSCYIFFTKLGFRVFFWRQVFGGFRSLVRLGSFYGRGEWGEIRVSVLSSVFGVQSLQGRRFEVIVVVGEAGFREMVQYSFKGVGFGFKVSFLDFSFLFYFCFMLVQEER